MSEFIIIAGEPAAVPPEVVSDGRIAVQSWHKAQLIEHGIPFTVAPNGDPVFARPEAVEPDVSPEGEE